MASLKPAFALPPVGANTSHLLPSSNGLNTPELLFIDSARHSFPIYFCGEKFPVDEPRVSRRWLQTIRTYGVRQNYLFGLRHRASTFFPIIEPILRRYKIPRDFRFMPIAESDLISEAVSSKGAVGYWQLMPGTARDLGLIVNDEIDERYHLLKATVAVCRHLRYLHQELKSWTLVAAAYNSGMAYVQSRMEQQGHSNYYRLRLNPETSHYMFRILAYKELFNNPRHYTSVLYSSTATQRLKPLPSWHRPLILSKKGKDAPTVELVYDDYANPAWGPRSNRALTQTMSDTQQLIAKATSKKSVFNAPDTDLDKPGSHFPIRKLIMGLMVLRFRRPRFLEWEKGRSNRPWHFWDWL